MLRKHSRLSIAFVWEGGRVEKRQRRLGIIAYGIPLRPKELSMIPTWVIRLYGRIRWWPLHGTSVSIYPSFLRSFLRSFVRKKQGKNSVIYRLKGWQIPDLSNVRRRRRGGQQGGGSWDSLALCRCYKRGPGNKKLIHISYPTAKQIAKSCELHSAKLPTHITHTHTHTQLLSVYAST